MIRCCWVRPQRQELSNILFALLQKYNLHQPTRLMRRAFKVALGEWPRADVTDPNYCIDTAHTVHKYASLEDQDCCFQAVTNKRPSNKSYDTHALSSCDCNICNFEPGVAASKIATGRENLFF